MYNHIRHYSRTPYPAVQKQVLDTLEHLRNIHQRSPTIQELSVLIGVSVELIIESLEYNEPFPEKVESKPVSIHPTH